MRRLLTHFYGLLAAFNRGSARLLRRRFSSIGHARGFSVSVSVLSGLSPRAGAFAAHLSGDASSLHALPRARLACARSDAPAPLRGVHAAANS